MKTTAFTFVFAIVAAFAFVDNAKAYNPYSPYWPKAEASVPPICKNVAVKDASVPGVWKNVAVKDASVPGVWKNVAK